MHSHYYYMNPEEDEAGAGGQTLVFSFTELLLHSNVSEKKNQIYIH